LTDFLGEEGTDYQMENIVQEVSSQPFSVQVHSPQQSPCGHDAGDWIDGHQAISQQF